MYHTFTTMKSTYHFISTILFGSLANYRQSDCVIIMIDIKERRQSTQTIRTVLTVPAFTHL